APHDLGGGQEIAFFLTVVTAERAKAAVLDADVGEVDVAVHHERDRVAHLTAPQLVGGDGQGEQIASGRVREPIALGNRDLVAGECALEDAAHVARGVIESRAGTTSVASVHAMTSRARRRRSARPRAREASRRRTPHGWRTPDTRRDARETRSRPPRSRVAA